MTDEVRSIRPTPVGRPLSGVAALVAGPPPDTDCVVTGITHDSRQVRPGDLYVALAGSHTHGARHWPEAASRGAVAVLTDPEGARVLVGAGPPVVVCTDPRGQLGEVASWVYGRPGSRLQVVGITGTNGKTTVAGLVEAAVSSCAAEVGVIGTTGVRGGGYSIPSARTTPEATDLQAILAAFVERGVKTVVMEVSSHALSLNRVAGIHFAVAAFTNLTQDHLDFHGDLDSYFAAKSRLFEPGRTDLGIVNADCPRGARLADVAGIPVETFGLDAGCSPDWLALDVVRDGIGYRFRLTGPNVDEPAAVGLPGEFNLSNAVCAAAVAISCGYEPQGVVRGIASARGPAGRMERVPVRNGGVVLVDYAHTPDAVMLAGWVGRKLADAAGGALTVVLGAGGDRDHDKRESMGRAAAEVADRVIVTDDNPRTERPAAIRGQVLAGARGHRAEVIEIGNRARAVVAALAGAGPEDVVMLLGKGHESGQEVAGVVTPMDDRELIRAADRELSP